MTKSACTACAIAALAVSESASAGVTVLEYTGNPFTLVQGNTGPIVGRVEFSSPLVDGVTLTQADVQAFQFTSDGVTWTNAADVLFMTFVFGPSLLPEQWEVILEQEIVGGNGGVEQLTTSTTGPTFWNFEFDEVILGDLQPGTPFSESDGGQSQNTGSAGTWVLVPAPGTTAVLGLAGLVAARRRR